MKYSLDIHIITNNQLILDTIRTNVPNKLDATVWANEYTISEETNLDGNKFISVMVRFNNMSDGQILKKKIQDKLTPTVLSKILIGSYLRLHTCNHDDSKRIGGCVEIEIWRK